MPELLNDILFRTGNLLRDAGIRNQFLEARVLVSTVLNRQVNQVHPAMSVELTDEQSEKLDSLVARRCIGEPLQLITGLVGFYNCVLKCEKGVLIPRMETEILVDRALEILGEFPLDKSARILDLGTGTGAIPIAIATVESRHSYYGVDQSRQAVDLAHKNAGLNMTRDRTWFYQGNYFEPVHSWKDVRFDLITANPPYIKTGDLKNLDREVVEWDPKSALDGGPDGLDHYRVILKDIPNYLANDGKVLFEIDPSYVDPLKKIVSDRGLTISGVFKDYDGNDRVIEITTLEM
jgi:release factor glutamine methyltransferase